MHGRREVKIERERERDGGRRERGERGWVGGRGKGRGRERGERKRGGREREGGEKERESEREREREREKEREMGGGGWEGDAGRCPSVTLTLYPNLTNTYSNHAARYQHQRSETHLKTGDSGLDASRPLGEWCSADTVPLPPHAPALVSNDDLTSDSVTQEHRSRCCSRRQSRNRRCEIVVTLTCRPDAGHAKIRHQAAPRVVTGAPWVAAIVGKLHLAPANMLASLLSNVSWPDLLLCGSGCYWVSLDRVVLWSLQQPAK